MNDNQASIPEVISAWRKYWGSGGGNKEHKLKFAWVCDFVDRIISDHPEDAFQLIVAILNSLEGRALYPVLAAGEVEELLVLHGEETIELFEKEAIVNSELRYLLGGVWKSDIKESVWKRLQACVAENW